MFDWVDMFWSRCRKFGLGLAVVCALCSGGVAPVQALPLPGGEVELAQGQGESQQESEQIPESSEESSGSVVQNSEDAENSSEASVPEDETSSSAGISEPKSSQPDLSSEVGASAAEPALQRRLDRLTQRVQNVRGLRFKKKVDCNFCTRAQASQYIDQANAQYAKPEVTARREWFYRLLGLLSGTDTLEECVSGLYSEQISGLYDTINKVLLVVTDIVQDPSPTNIISKLLEQFDIDLSDILLAHELCHALQDQNFNLGSNLLSVDGNLDRELALSALAEGDATDTMFAFLSSSMGLNNQLLSNYLSGSPKIIRDGVGQFPKLKNAPAIVRETTLMPYLEGLNFCRELHKQGRAYGVDVDTAFKRFPQSTEQILHPSKYIRNEDNPKAVDLSGLPKQFGDYLSLGDDTAGEFIIKTWVESSLGDKNRAVNVASGWAGDRWRTYVKKRGNTGLADGKESFIVWLTAWDTEPDAGQFKAAAEEILGNRAFVKKSGSNVVVTVNVPVRWSAGVRAAVDKIRAVK